MIPPKIGYYVIPIAVIQYVCKFSVYIILRAFQTAESLVARRLLYFTILVDFTCEIIKLILKIFRLEEDKR